MKIPSITAIVRVALLAVTVGCAGPGVRAQSTIWQIGEFNHSSIEFNHDLDFDQPNLSVLYTIGQNKPADWPAYQRAASSFRISFTLPRPAGNNYLLTISLVINRPRYPNLLIDVNGKKGLYYVYRRLSDYPGDGGVDSPIYGEAKLEIPLQASLFHEGRNTLTLTAVDESPEADPKHLSYLIYDAIRLTQQPESSQPVPSVSVEPTVFFREKGSELYERTDVTVTLPEKIRRGSVELVLPNQRFHSALSAVNDFGQQKFSFDARALDKPAQARVFLRLNGKTRRFDVSFAPARKWTIDFVPHAHLDIGYTDLQPKVAAVQTRNIDKLLDYLPLHPDMRFSLDGSWIVQNYMLTRNAAAQEKFLNLVRQDKIAVPAQYANLLTGYASLEELIRSADFTYALHRARNIPFDYANITDVPSQTWSYPSVLNALGVRYFAAAANSDRAPILLYGHWDTKSPFWWQGPDGSKVLMAYTRQYSQFYFVCDMPPQMANCEQGLPTFLQTFEAPVYKPDTVLMYGSQFENTDLQLTESEFVRRWNSQYAYPRFVITTFPGYFRDIEKRYGPALATVTGDGGPYWEDGIGSDAQFTAIDRRDQQRALSAEKLSTIATFLDPNLAPPRSLIASMWQNLLLYAEHTFDSWDSVYRPDSEESKRQLAVKNQYVRDGAEEINSLTERSLSQIANKIHMPAGTFLVFNTLSWRRSALVTLDLDDGSAIGEYPSLKPVPVDVLRKGPGYSRVRFLARDVPAMGFTCYKFLEQDKKAPPPAVEKPHPASAIENAFYRIEVDPASGAVTSIFDKQLNKELVDRSSPFKLDQYLYVSGGGEGRTQIVYLQKSLPLARLTVHPSAGGRLVGVRTTPYGQVLTLQSQDLHTPSIRSEIILFDDEKKIEFVNRFRKEAVTDKEAVYFAFPLAIDNPEFAYEIQNGWVDPARDMLKGAGVEWFTVHHWVRISNNNVSVALVPADAPLVTLGDINRGAWPDKFVPRSSAVFSYALNNYWHTNYRAGQGGDFTFRYFLTSARRLSPADLARLGRSAMTPLEVDKVVDQDKYDDPSEPLPPAPLSFLEVSAPDVVVENWKAANDGHGSILRLLETAGQASQARLTFPMFDLEHAWITNAVEENQQQIPVSGSSVEIPVKPHQILTLRIAGALKTSQ